MSQLNTNTEGLQSLLEMANALPDPIEIDASLSQSGMAADAKAVGDAIAHKSNTGHTHNASEITEGTLAVERLETSGVTANSYGPTDSVTTGTFNVPQITVDTYGRVTKVVDRPVTLPTANSGNTSPYILPTASSDELGGVKIGYTTSGKNYAVQLDDSDKMYVNVPWTDTNTTYSQGTGISISSNTVSLATVSGLTATSYGPSANASPSHSGTFSVPYFTVDSYGRITSAATRTITLPSDSNSHYNAYLYLGASGASSNATSAVSDPYINLRENSTNRSSIQIKGGSNVTVSGSSGVITISASTSSSVATYNSFGIIKVDSSSLTVSSGVLSLSKTDIKNILGYEPANPADIPSTSGFVTTASLNSTLNGYVTTTSLNSTLGSYVTSSSLSTTLGSYAKTTALSSYVPTTRTVNGKALSSNITLSRTDVGANKCFVQSSTPSGAVAGDLWIQT